MFEDLDILIDIHDLRKLGLSEEEIDGYLEFFNWESEENATV